MKADTTGREQDGLIELSGLPPQVVGTLVEVNTAGPLKERLIDLGFTPGCPLRVVRTGPANNLIAVTARQTTVALRSKEAQSIIVRKEEAICRPSPSQ